MRRITGRGMGSRPSLNKRSLVGFLSVLTVVFLPTATLAASPPPPPRTPQQQTPNKIANLNPAQGHLGDPIYASGEGFRPYTQLILLLACPKYDDPIMLQNGNDVFQNGPVTDRNGAFSAFKLHKLSITGVKLPISCLFYVSYVNQPLVSDFPFVYFALPRSVSLPRCSLRICFTVSPHTVEQHHQRYESIDIAKGWGGAMASVTVKFPGVAANAIKQPKPKRLDPFGKGSFTVAVPSSVGLNATGTVTVQLRLDKSNGNLQRSFRVLRTNLRTVSP